MIVLYELFSLYRVFGPEATNKDVYEASAQGIVRSVVDGFHGICMAYGQTGSGKTHTMRAIMAQAVQDIFMSIRSKPEVRFLTPIDPRVNSRRSSRPPRDRTTPTTATSATTATTLANV